MFNIANVFNILMLHPLLYILCSLIQGVNLAVGQVTEY